MSDIPRQIYEFGPFTFDPQRRLLLREGERVQLTGKAFEILSVLLHEKGRLVEKEELMRRVWPDAAVEENNLTVNMSALRKSLRVGPRDHRYLVTVPGRGYQFVAEVREHDLERAETEPQAAINQPVARGASEPRHKYTAVVLAVLLGATLVVASISYSRYFGANNKVGTGSVAVLPFTNVGDDPNSEYLSDGIAESLINSLSELRGVKVVASNSSFQYKNKKVDLQNVATALGVDQIITGRVSRRGETLTISVELVNGRDGTHLWGEQYDRKATDAVLVEAEISKQIAEQLRSRLTASEEQVLSKRVSVNPQAYELLLKGRFYWRKQDYENQKRAVEYYEQAISVDPNYALAHAQLAAVYMSLYSSGLLDPKQFKPRAEAEANKALELDEGLADAHNALASLKQNDWQWAAAEREYHRALQLNPNLAEALHFYSYYLMVTGQYDEAIAMARRGRELDPLSLDTSTLVVVCLTMARRYDEAIELSLKILELDPNSAQAHGVLAGAYAGKGRYREAIKEYEESIKLGGDSPTDQIYLGSFYAKEGDRKKAGEILKRLETTKEYVSPGELAVLYAALNERQQAFASLEKAYAAHDLQLQYLGIDPSFDSLRDDPHFKDLMRRVGLA